MYVDLVGNVPTCFQRTSMWWQKVFAAQRLLNCRRAKSLLWLDTDAIIAPILATCTHRAAPAALQFPSLQEIWDNAMAKMRLQPADGGELANGGVRARGGVPADGGPFFLEY